MGPVRRQRDLGVVHASHRQLPLPGSAPRGSAMLPHDHDEIMPELYR